MERSTVDPASSRSNLGVSIDSTDLAIVHYRLAPGDGFPSGLHAHYDQEEVFVVLEGDALFEVLPPAGSWDGDRPTGREVAVGAGETVRFAPGEFQTGRNPEAASDNLVALALGAPRDTSDVHVPAPCQHCDAHTLRLGTGGDAFTLDCPDCDIAFEPAPCLECGSHDLSMHLDASDRPVSRCHVCGYEHEKAPLDADAESEDH